MSDKTRERVRAEFEAHYSKTYNKPPHLIRDSRVRNAIVSDGYTETHQLGIDLNIAYRAWQAAHEMYAPKCERITDLERRNGELEKALTDLCHGCEQSFDWQYDPEFTKEFNAAFAVLTQHPQGESNGR